MLSSIVALIITVLSALIVVPISFAGIIVGVIYESIILGFSTGKAHVREGYVIETNNSHKG